MSARPPVVSVVTPAFNAAATIAETIESIQAQTIEAWEMIIVDDGSTDDTQHVVRSFQDPRIRFIPIAHTGTPAAARNRGVEEARASRVAFIDADDMWTPDFLERELAVMDESGADVVHCRWVNFDGRTTVEEPPHAPPGPMAHLDLLRAIVSRHFLSMCAVVVDRSALLAVGLFDPDPRLRGTEDFELWLRLAPRSTFVHIVDRLLIVRIRQESISRNITLNVRGTILALEKLMARDPDLARQVDGELRARMGDLYLTLGTYMLLHGTNGRGIAELRAAVRYRPGNPRAWLWLALSLSGRRAARAWSRARSLGAPERTA